jgi:tRNA pseudouridine38-40 synthase
MELGYNGQAYHGWQTQPGDTTVQETVEKGLSTLLRKNIQVVGCGRTDAGVHASQYFLHFDTDKGLGSENVMDESELVFKLNSILPDDIAVYRVFAVKESAHARFDALSRSYEYKIYEGKSPFLKGLVWQKRVLNLDVERMNEAASMLLDYSDFKSFSRSKTDVKTYICRVDEAMWQLEDDLLVFHISADRFLRNMVRAIVGTLIEIGQGKREIQDMKRVIESRDRTQAGPSVKAEGLYLSRVKYPENLWIE